MWTCSSMHWRGASPSSRALTVGQHLPRSASPILRSLATHAPQVLSTLANQIMVVLLGCMQAGAPAPVATKAATVAEELLVKHEYVGGC